MKTKFFTVTALFLTQALAFAQAPIMQWQKTLGGTSNDIVNSIQPTNDGGYIVAGFTNSNNGEVTGSHGNYDSWVVKLSATGVLQWQKTLGGTSYDVANSIQQTADSGYIVAGYTSSNDGDVSGNHGLYDYWVVKLSTTGDVQWQKSLGGAGNEVASSIQQTADGGYIVAGYSNSTGNHGGFDYWVVKLSATGVLQWQKSLGGTGDENASSIQQTSDGGYIVAGYTSSNDGDATNNHGNNDVWVIKLSATGDLQWQKTLGGTGYDIANSIQQTSDGGYFVAGYTSSNDVDVTGNHGNNDCWVVKLNTNGSLEWEKCLGGSNTDQANSIQQTDDGGCIVAGFTASNDGDVIGNQGINDYWVVKLSATGDMQWQKTLGGTSDDRACSIRQTPDGGFVVAGNTSSSNGDVTGNHGGNDFWIVKLGTELTTSAFMNPPYKVFPTPTTATLHIQTNNNQPADQLTIYDLTGKLIFTQTQPSNLVEVGPLAAGMYLLEVVQGEERAVLKFVKK